ncbi:MAG: hypothetical protein JWM14_1470 [Chitinophagaceae bacterium]|nr:hypothetical protein [Chitinophagaceae bacterium]
MKQLIVLFLSIIFFCCTPSTEKNERTLSNKEEKSNMDEFQKNTEIPTSTIIKTPYYERRVSTIYSNIYQTDSIDLVIQRFLKSHRDTTCTEIGADDAWGKYCVYSNAKTEIKVTIGMTSCGDYGYHVNHYITRKDSILSMREFRFDIDIGLTPQSPSQYHLNERILYFQNHLSILKERSKISQDVCDSTVNDKKFTIQQIKGDSIYHSEIKYYNDLLH